MDVAKTEILETTESVVCPKWVNCTVCECHLSKAALLTEENVPCFKVSVVITEAGRTCDNWRVLVSPRKLQMKKMK